jgi:hypothetical protein
MTRKERIELKTVKFCEQVCDAMKGPGTVRDAAERADKFLNEQIQMRPQEKSFILNCGYIVATTFDKLLDERIKWTELFKENLK